MRFLCCAPTDFRPTGFEKFLEQFASEDRIPGAVEAQMPEFAGMLLKGAGETLDLRFGWEPKIYIHFASTFSHFL